MKQGAFFGGERIIWTLKDQNFLLQESTNGTSWLRRGDLHGVITALSSPTSSAACFAFAPADVKHSEHSLGVDSVPLRGERARLAVVVLPSPPQFIASPDLVATPKPLRMFHYDLLDETQNKLDYILPLSLTVENFLECRLHILVFKSGMAKFIHQCILDKRVQGSKTSNDSAQSSSAMLAVEKDDRHAIADKRCGDLKKFCIVPVLERILMILCRQH
ncbi:hypothetical protein Ahy_A05g021968 isoform A [Arachis hypogaea]|uniref:Uncharacterized protein n=1 Tax=Arachis hypogaea TaxID=3818 RepID=A0A445CZ15_ARAHY|nr:hypothetical protein Ahy_A05g021968 isoform A [Arachis hypogaea]